LARAAMRLPRMDFQGLMTFPNRDPGTGVFFERALALFKQAGIPVPIVSGGGTPALATVGKLPMLTEHRAGTCVYNDAMVVELAKNATWDECAMRVRATVVSRPAETRAIIDAGTKVLTSDLYGMKGYGHVMEYPAAVVAGLSEEHGTLDLSACPERPAVGDVVHVVPNHCCVVSNMVDEVYGVRGDRVEVVWPVAARGKVRERHRPVRIEDFRTFIVHDGYRSFVFLKLYTEDGLTGVGEATVEWNELAAEACLRQTCARIRGADAGATEALWERLYRDSYWRNDLVINSAISAIDQACWDLKGKKLGAPVHALLGGKRRERLRAYANAWYWGCETPE